ncbi:MAG: hypothetical protein U0103_26890 [Candidatus Obscuribacterales bacterium]
MSTKNDTVYLITRDPRLLIFICDAKTNLRDFEHMIVTDQIEADGAGNLIKLDTGEVVGRYIVRA